MTLEIDRRNIWICLNSHNRNSDKLTFNSNKLTFASFRHLFSGPFLGGQQLLDSLGLAGHVWMSTVEWGWGAQKWICGWLCLSSMLDERSAEWSAKLRCELIWWFDWVRLLREKFYFIFYWNWLKSIEIRQEEGNREEEKRAWWWEDCGEFALTMEQQNT